MALNKKNLLIMLQMQKRVYEYVSSEDTLADMDTTGYFNDAADELVVNTPIFAYASDGFGILTVNANNGLVVDTANALKPAGDSD